jgi:hypothetical protein
LLPSDYGLQDAPNGTFDLIDFGQSPRRIVAQLVQTLGHRSKRVASGIAAVEALANGRIDFQQGCFMPHDEYSRPLHEQPLCRFSRGGALGAFAPAAAAAEFRRLARASARH